MVPDVTVQNIDEHISLYLVHKMLCCLDVCNPGGQRQSSELMLDIGLAVSVLPEPFTS